MIKLEFVGNKPIISPKGVTFAQHKHDKFEFIEPAIHILAMCLELNEDHPTEKIDPNETFGQERILETLLKANPDFMKTYEKSMESHKNHLDEEIEAVDETNLSQEDKEAYRNNYKFMKEYRIQRATNKLVYEEIINSCVDLIIERRIADIKAPFSIPFMHVLGSLETTLEQQKNSPRSMHISAQLDKETSIATLHIEF